ncbi:LysR family transcriptional regulator [Clostridium sp. Cult3]|uniref:LysR family transcriptional regulator n=1 Tax=Clostridium sp. Cult3 TaxID=2079004 RepID=UPI001F2AA3D6|nr:LysR family transcriptional regulator [Clostridium sp. Cult3]MCF6460956.1 LysR family transcriptional regulator [Clostridium sp. Cult3]
MNLDYLRSFYVTVKCNSISKAAKVLHLTQPGLSMQIQNLEDEIGATLLERSNKGVELTDEGRIVFEHATTMLSLQDNIKKSLRDLEKDKKTLSICACKSLGEYVLPCSIYTFREIYTDVDVKLEVYNTNTVIKKLLSHDTNIGIITGFHEFKNITTVPILSDRLLLVSGPYEEHNEIYIDEVLNIPLILREEDSNNRAVLANILLKHGINIDDLNIVLSSNSPESIKSTVASGRGFAFLPEVVIKQELRRGILKQIEIKDFDANFSYYFAYRNNYEFKGYEKTFKNFITSKKRCFCY